MSVCIAGVEGPAVRAYHAALDEMSGAVEELRRDPDDAGAVVALLEGVRVLHREARGPARDQLVELATKVEALLQRVRQGIAAVDDRMLEALGASVGLARDLARTPSGGDQAVAHTRDAGHEVPVERRVTPLRAEVTVAVVGSGQRAADLVRLLADDERVALIAACAPSPTAPVFRAAHEAGIPTTLDLATLATFADISLVIDVSEDPDARARLEATLPPGVQLVGPAAAYLLRELLEEVRSNEWEQQQAEHVRAEIEEVRRQAARLQVGRDELERTNEVLNRQLAETYFIHEFFKALNRAQDVDGVCSVIADGASGLLGAEITAVYVIADEARRLVLRAYQGRTEPAFLAVAPVVRGVLSSALDGSQFSGECEGPVAEWVREQLCWQAALPLTAGRETLGVLALGGTAPRDLTMADRERFGVVSEQCALALQNARLHEDLELLAVTDRMTCMYNHVYGIQRLDEEVKRAARFGHPLSVIMLDIDDFKSFNDTYGHPAGDELLFEVGEVIRRALREMDIAVRYGGDEFAVILPETPARGALLVAERVRNDIGELGFELGTDGPVGRTVSIGVAEFPSDGTSGRLLVEAADRALYGAKRAGKNRVESA